MSLLQTHGYLPPNQAPGHTVIVVEQVPQTRHGVAYDKVVMVSAWSADFCGCCDSIIPNCCMVTWCPCISLAQISARLGVASYWRVLIIFMLLSLAECFAGLYPYYLNENTDWRHSSTSTEYSDANRPKTNPAQSWSIAFVRIVFFVYIWYLRQTTRQLFRIPGGPCGDCWASLCCSCCSLAQIATHVKSYKPGDCSFGPPDVLPPYPGTQSL